MSDCLFCGIVDGKIKANVVYQDDAVVAFKDIAPKAPVHILIIPRKHLVGVADVGEQDRALVGEIFNVAAKLAREQGIPMREDPDLVQMLTQIDLDQEIPPSLYKVVAELLAFVYRLNQSYHRPGGG